MIINEIKNTAVEPVDLKRDVISIDDAIDVLVSSLIKLNPKYYHLYDKSFVKNNKGLLKDTLNNYRSQIIDNNSLTPENISFINKIFSLTDQQMSLLEDAKIEMPSNADVCVIFLATFISHFKKLIS